MKLALAALLLAATSFAAEPPRFYGMAEKDIAAALKKIHKDAPTLQGRVEAVSAALLGIPYKLGPLGEGPSSRFDGDPLYSFKRLDCTTSIEEIMALSLDADLDHALKVTLQRIRYKDGVVDYTQRNHFTELDWVPNNVAAGFLKDITQDVAGAKTRNVRHVVSKHDWYAHKTLDAIKGFPALTPAQRQARLAELQGLASTFKDEASTISYVPIELLPQLLGRIPSGTIANLVRADQPGKPTVISHQVLLIDKGGTKVVREASFGREFLDVPALDYFYLYFNSSWPLLGLNLNRITDPGAP